MIKDVNGRFDAYSALPKIRQKIDAVIVRGTEKAPKYNIRNKKVQKKNLSEEEKEAKREYGKNRCRNMTKNENNKLKEYQTSYSCFKISVFLYE